jgi:Ricin-type beta-trefoil lectin domain-like
MRKAILVVTCAVMTLAITHARHATSLGSGSVVRNTNDVFLSIPSTGEPADLHVYVKNKKSGKCLDVAGGDQYGLDNGNWVHQWTCGNQKSQKWWFVEIPGRYEKYLKTGHSGKCLDIVNQATANGTKTHQWDCYQNLDSQKWFVSDEGVAGGYVRIYSKLSTKCLDVENQSNDDGAKVHTWDCYYGQDMPDSQKWQLIPVK